MKEIRLTRGQVAIVDDDDFEKFGRFKFQAIPCLTGGGYYANGHFNGKKRFLHREIMGSPKGLRVDHKNGDKLDCRKENLRVCTVAQNAMNRKGAQKNSKTGVRGVSPHRDGKRFTAAIGFGNRMIILGHFDTVKEASKSYADANKKYFGEFGGNRG